MGEPQVFEGEIRVLRDYEGGPTLLIDRVCLVESVEYGEISYATKCEWEEDAYDLPGRWRITVERLDEEAADER